MLHKNRQNIGKNWDIFKPILKSNYNWSLYSRVSQLQIQPTSEQKYLGKNSRTFQGNFNLPSADNYLHSIYIIYATVYTAFILYSVQFSPSVVSDSLRPHGLQNARPPCPPGLLVRQASLSVTNSYSLLKFMSIESVIPSSHFILCCLLLLLPSIFPSIRVFSNESVFHITWPKYWSFSFNISPSNEHSGLISFRMDRLDFFAVQGTLKSLLQHHSSKASILQRSAFFILQLSYPYMTTGKTIALTRQTFVGKVMSLIFNMLSGLVITFLPRSKRLLISWLQSPSAVILEPPKNKVCHCFHCFPIYLSWSDRTGCHDLSFLNVEF